MNAVCPSWLADRQDDLVQSALLGLLKHRNEHEKKGLTGGKAAPSEHNQGFSSSYLRKVAYHALIDEIRRQRRRREVALEEDGEPVDVAERLDPEKAYAGREIGRGIQECLKRLLPPRRHAVLLVLLGHTMPEAAQLLGWNLKRTKNLVFRGREDLRECLSLKGLRP